MRRLKQRRRERGDLKPRRGGHDPRKFDRGRLAELVADRPDATLTERREALGVDESLSAICVTLKRLGLIYQKRRSTPRSMTGPTSPSVGRTGR
ncbi:MAG: hypothetical protein AAGG38_12740 [Planctomycetota bacterium]